MSDSDKVFGGSISKVYATHLVPMIFEPYAADLAKRLAGKNISRLLEIAAGTGVVTRALAQSLPPSVSIVATDLSPAMLAEASELGTSRPVEWREADAMKLPFPDQSFDAVVCQFGAMFFPDKSVAYSEARRVLKPGGIFLFNVWDSTSENEFAEIVVQTLQVLFPIDPPNFLRRTPYGHHDRKTLENDLAKAGFTNPVRIESVPARGLAPSALSVAIGYCQGTPTRAEIEARDPARMGEATEAVAAAIAKRFGQGKVDGKIQAVVISVTR